QNDLKLFESSRIYFRKDEKLSTEKHHISGLMAGNLSPVWWKEKQKPVDFFDLKGIIEEILNSFGLLEISYENSSEPFYQPGLAADINIKKQNFGSFGKLDQKITRKYNIEQPVFVFDLKLNDLIDHKISDEIVFRSIPRFPVVQRDLAFVVSEEFDLHQIKRSILQTNRKFIKKIVLFDEYKGKNIKKGFRSLAFGFTLGSDEKTLTDDSIKAIINKIISKLQKEFKIEMR
ncbi:MAG: hypothetical protein H8E57_03105, partial [Candidatus Cloacimonetes bacterium]|nr:hypothetical protein [Candidatus Cloacimonadota bacterium]